MTPGRAIPGVTAPHSDGGEVFNWAHTDVTIDGKSSMASQYAIRETRRSAWDANPVRFRSFRE